jgi:hypothetical protein
MRRIMMLVVVALVMAAMMAVTALPALAQGPSTLPPGAFLALAIADKPNPAIEFDQDNQCVTLDTPGPGRGHHSGFPDDSPCQPQP